MRYNSFDGTYMWKKKGEYKCRICRDNVKEYRRYGEKKTESDIH